MGGGGGGGVTKCTRVPGCGGGRAYGRHRARHDALRGGTRGPLVRLEKCRYVPSPLFRTLWRRLMRTLWRSWHVTYFLLVLLLFFFRYCMLLLLFLFLAFLFPIFSFPLHHHRCCLRSLLLLGAVLYVLPFFFFLSFLLMPAGSVLGKTWSALFWSLEERKKNRKARMRCVRTDQSDERMVMGKI